MLLAWGALAPASATAEGILEWEYDPVSQEVDSADVAEITIRLSNTGDMDLVDIDMGIWFGDLGTLPDVYTVATAPPSTIQNLDLAPGADTSFVFATLTPLGGSVPAGVYGIGGISIQFTIDGSSSFYGNTGDHASVTVTPEPGTTLLLAAGLAGLGARRRRARRH